jgi:outer membrane lipoprotein-sorting protein
MLNRFRKVCVLLAVGFCLTILSVQDIQADGLTAEEIMAKSQEAMNQPLNYTLVSDNGMEMVVYRKTLPDGSSAKLVSFPSTKKINLVYGKMLYDIRLEHQIAIDLSNIFQSTKDLADSSFGSDLKDRNHQKSYELIGTVWYNDKDCYEILGMISPEAGNVILDRLPENKTDKVGAKERFWIDKETYLIQAEEKLSEEGVTLSKKEYRDIHPQPDLSDDFFQIPPDLEVLFPQSTKEYAAIITGLRPRPDFEAQSEHARKEMEEEVERIQKEAHERSEQRANQLEESMEQIKKEVKEKSEQIRKERNFERFHEPYPLPETSNNRWGVFVAVNGIVIALIMILWLRHRWNK